MASRLSVIHGVIASTLFAYGVSVLTVVWAGTRDVLVFGLVGAIPAAGVFVAIDPKQENVDGDLRPAPADVEAWLRSVPGQTETSARRSGMSVLPPEADI